MYVRVSMYVCISVRVFIYECVYVVQGCLCVVSSTHAARVFPRLRRLEELLEAVRHARRREGN